jgi:hypothetical protein
MPSVGSGRGAESGATEKFPSRTILDALIPGMEREMVDQSSRVALVTGASGEIGSVRALRLAADGTGTARAPRLCGRDQLNPAEAMAQLWVSRRFDMRKRAVKRQHEANCVETPLGA